MDGNQTDVGQTDVGQTDVGQDHVGQTDVGQTDVGQMECDAKTDLRIPQILKNEIKRQADDLGMSASALIKDVLIQHFIKH